MNEAKERKGENNSAGENEILKELLSWVKVIAAAVLFALVINNFVIVNASVPSGSMLDTIPEHSRIVAFRLAYLLSEPERFDVIVFKYPDNEAVYYVKRVIGLPGEKVEIIDGKVYINDSQTPLEDSFVKGIPYSSSGPFYVPEGAYFMLGDNRNNSEDSRYWTNKFVYKEKILGEVFVCYWPNIKLIK